MGANGLTYAQVIQSYTSYDAQQSIIKTLRYLDELNLSPSEYSAELQRLTGRTATPYYYVNGQLGGYTYSRTVEFSTPNPINSNAGTLARGTVTQPIATTVDGATGKTVSQALRGVGSKAITAAAEVATWAAAASVAITLGKTIDSTLYNANPDFWDSHGMSSLNPDTWNNITSGIDYTDPITGTAASAMNFIFGLDPDTGEAQAYMRDDAFAYMATYLQSQGAFDKGYNVLTDDTLQEYEIDNFNFIKIGASMVNSSGYQTSFPYMGDVTGLSTNYGGHLNAEYFPVLASAVGEIIIAWTGINRPQLYIASKESIPNSRTVVVADNYSNWFGFGGNYTYTYNNKTIHWGTSAASGVNGLYYPQSNDVSLTVKQLHAAIWGNAKEIGSVTGINTQPNATIPTDLSNSDIPYNLNQLQQQYPDLWNNAIDYPVVNPDGTTTNYKYIPVTLPEISSNTQAQPTSGGQTQINPNISPDTSPDVLVEYLQKILQSPQEDTFTDTTQPPENPTDTGDGSSPIPVAPTGNASALWAIYHPTQVQIDAFGAWLWSSNFVDQLLKIFNNPMESIIGLHKIYASPVDAGTSTIAVGYLDSEVPSAYIEQQYVDVNCGSISLSEQFGNVFDYAPFTNCKLYLPFIGIVNLDVSEVMRSTISIDYSVDVLTGACLAKVTVSRDGNSSILYQFAGNCAVQYPLSMGSYMGIVSSILGVAGSAVATFASGGSLAPLAIGAASAALGAHTSVQNSGNFSSNAGAMGGKIPYLIIERPQTRIADNQESFEGVPTNEYQELGNHTGFVQCRDMHIVNIGATSEEITEIQEYLRNGVIV